MLHFPLLTDEYGAALSEAADERSFTSPAPAQSEESRAGLAEEERDNADPTKDLPDDMETARTRPLRLDRLPILRV